MSLCTHQDERQRVLGEDERPLPGIGAVKPRKKEKILFLVLSSRWAGATSNQAGGTPEQQRPGVPATARTPRQFPLKASNLGLVLSYSLLSLLGTGSADTAGAIIRQQVGPRILLTGPREWEGATCRGWKAQVPSLARSPDAASHPNVVLRTCSSQLHVLAVALVASPPISELS